MLTFSDPSSGIATGAAAALLEMEAPPPASHAERVSFVSPLPEAPRALPLQRVEAVQIKIQVKKNGRSGGDSRGDSPFV